MSQDTFNRFMEILALSAAATPAQMEELGELMHDLTPEEFHLAHSAVRKSLIELRQIAAENGTSLPFVSDGEVEPN